MTPAISEAMVEELRRCASKPGFWRANGEVQVINDAADYIEHIIRFRKGRTFSAAEKEALSHLTFHGMDPATSGLTPEHVKEILSMLTAIGATP